METTEAVLVQLFHTGNRQLDQLVLLHARTTAAAIVHLQMSIQRIQAQKGLLTILAHVRSHASVDALVTLQIMISTKSQSTSLASVWALNGMTLDMALQIMVLVKLFIASRKVARIQLLTFNPIFNGSIVNLLSLSRLFSFTSRGIVKMLQ